MSTGVLNDLVADYLDMFSDLYPGIQGWYHRISKEAPLGRRTIIALVRRGRIEGLAITKNSAKAKLCHISIAKDLRERGAGMRLMRAAIYEMIEKGARRVHVTTGDDVVAEHGRFFARCGFEIASLNRNRYRRGHDEFVWSASPATLIRRLAIHPADSLRIHPQFSCEDDGLDINLHRTTVEWIDEETIHYPRTCIRAILTTSNLPRADHVGFRGDLPSAESHGLYVQPTKNRYWVKNCGAMFTCGAPAVKKAAVARREVSDSTSWHLRQHALDTDRSWR